MGLNLIFLGTPEFAVPTLEALVAAGHNILEVVTQPDRPKGRKQILEPSLLIATRPASFPALLWN